MPDPLLIAILCALLALLARGGHAQVYRSRLDRIEREYAFMRRRHGITLEDRRRWVESERRRKWPR